MSAPITDHADHAPEDSFSTALPLCYEILLYLASRMAKLKEGDTLEFVTSDPQAPDKIPDWCAMRGYTLLDTSTTADLSTSRWLIQK